MPIPRKREAPRALSAPFRAWRNNRQREPKCPFPPKTPTKPPKISPIPPKSAPSNRLHRLCLVRSNEESQAFEAERGKDEVKKNRSDHACHGAASKFPICISTEYVLAKIHNPLGKWELGRENKPDDRPNAPCGKGRLQYVLC